MRIFFKIFWKLTLSISAFLGCILILLLTVLSYFCINPQTIDWNPIIDALKQHDVLKSFIDEIQFIRDYSLYIAIAGTVFLIVVVISGIGYTTTKRKKKIQDKQK